MLWPNCVPRANWGSVDTSVPNNPSKATTAAVECKKLGLRYGDRQVLSGLDLRIDAGERIAVLGASGCGKTSLLRILAGLQAATSGHAQVLGRDPGQLRGRALAQHQNAVALLHQGDNLVPNLRVVHNVLMGRLGHWSALRGLLSLLWPQDLPAARAALREVELHDRLWDLPQTLSGGQRQRVAIARLLVQEPLLWLADEPTSQLDTRLGRGVLTTLLKAAGRSNATVVVSLHDLELLNVGFDRVIAMRTGRIWWQGTPDQLGEREREELYRQDQDRKTP